MHSLARRACIRANYWRTVESGVVSVGAAAVAFRLVVKLSDASVCRFVVKR